MILSFQDQFVEKIKAGTKVTTIREDSHRRWKPGMVIHFWKGSPRNPTKNPCHFATGQVVDVEDITLMFKYDEIRIDKRHIVFGDNLEFHAKQDGFDSWEDMKKWFDVDKFRGVRITWHPNHLEVLKCQDYH